MVKTRKRSSAKAATSAAPAAGFWRDRPVLVTGATGLLGGWLVRRLVAERAEVVALVRDWVPRSNLLSSDLVSRVTMVRGDVRDQDLLERVMGEYEIDTVFHLAAQTIVGVANRNPVSTLDTNIRGTWEAAVKPGIVLISLNTGSPSSVRKKSIRATPRQPSASYIAMAAARSRRAATSSRGAGTRKRAPPPYLAS
mgnify:CR=1 FL=1